jgi:hypothetical protein
MGHGLAAGQQRRKRSKVFALGEGLDVFFDHQSRI